MQPQPGFQTKALTTPADIAIIGGSAGGGKSWLLEFEVLRHINNPGFGATFFRRTTTQIRAQGGLWDTSKKIFYNVPGAVAKESLEWVFPSGARLKFAHLEYEQDVNNYQGSQIPYIAFDELTHFTKHQFWYMVSRNRTDCGVKPYIRASCNPDPNSWVAELVSWYIDQNTGYPIPERNGVIRYFTRDGDTLIWGDSREEVIAKAGHIFNRPELQDSDVDILQMVKSFTFISGNIFENKIFIKSDPSYLGTLLSLQDEEKKRLLEGNWKVSLDGLMLAKWERIEAIFSNYPAKRDNPKKYITCDAARFGRDFCVIKVWSDWECIFMVVMKISDAFDITGQIETLRQRFNVWKENVVVDADGVGDGTVKLGQYTPFHGGASVLDEMHIDAKSGKVKLITPNYYNLKTQCAFYLCEKKINTGEIRYSLNNETVLIFDGSKNGIYTTKIKVGGEIKDVRDLIKEDYRTLKRLETKDMGTDKKKTQPKETQKESLKRSPDFGDNGLMRAYCDLMPTKKTMSRTN